jgi:hypothetical protein
MFPFPTVRDECNSLRSSRLAIPDIKEKVRESYWPIERRGAKARDWPVRCAETLTSQRMDRQASDADHIVLAARAFSEVCAHVGQRLIAHGRMLAHTHFVGKSWTSN